MSTYTKQHLTKLNLKESWLYDNAGTKQNLPTM